MIGFLWGVAVVVANWLGALAGLAMSNRRTRRAGHDPDCDQWGLCRHEIGQR